MIRAVCLLLPLLATSAGCVALPPPDVCGCSDSIEPPACGDVVGECGPYGQCSCGPLLSMGFCCCGAGRAELPPPMPEPGLPGRFFPVPTRPAFSPQPMPTFATQEQPF